jgi:hypothetical protein
MKQTKAEEKVTVVLTNPTDLVSSFELRAHWRLPHGEAACVLPIPQPSQDRQDESSGPFCLRVLEAQEKKDGVSRE